LSCVDRSPGRARRRAARAGTVLAALAFVGVVAACGTEPDTGAAEGAVSSSASSARPADATTSGLAQVEVDRQCTIASTSFADEADITTDLDDRLATAGFTHQQWKEWHDALADSPELVAQFAEISTAGCAAG
jgi:hypothetical protein